MKSSALFLVVALANLSCGKNAANAPHSLSDEDQVCHINSIGMQFCVIPKGTFMMGSPKNEEGRDDNEMQHQVTLTKDFEMQLAEVTQAQWQEIMGTNPSMFQGADRPVETVSWNEIVENFLPKLNARLKDDGYTYRLPTEAEWEYAARGGTTGALGVQGEYYNFMWYSETSERMTHSVRQLKANKYRLHDMHGNVWEWVQDTYASYSSSPVTDPLRETGSSRVIRGGGWYNDARNCRSALRNAYSPVIRYYYIGFRLVRMPK